MQSTTSDGRVIYQEENGGRTWTASDVWASEDEVYDFLYGLVRLFKPKVILETGTYKGGAAKAMALAAKENGIGHVISCDIDAALCELVNTECASEQLPACSFYCDGQEFIKRAID